MSEQTPESTANTTDEDGFAAAESEPSMEDILASIRKIISDDADPLPLDGPWAAPAEETVVAEASLVSVADPSDKNDDPFDLDALLGDMDAVETSGAQPSSFANAMGITDMDTLDDDLAIPEIEADASPADAVFVDEDDMDRLMNELLVSMDGPTVGTQPDAPVTASIKPEALSPSVASDDNDMDIVKALMADLTDDDVAPSTDATLSDDMDLDLDAMMNEIADFDIDPVSEIDAADVTDAVSASDDIDALEDDIFDSILEMTLDDEVDAFDAASEVDSGGPSLADIAAAAEAEAVIDPTPSVVETALMATAQADASAPVVAEADSPPAKPIKSETAKPTPSEMETPMPSALRSDAILDDVTEKASMTAFAELNQVVEDKAILSERGPRIGDLVQDALKPMLKEWLDANIQSIVERAVAKEVKRIADGK